MCEAKNIIVEHVYGASENFAKLKLMKMSRGYQWELSLSGDDFKEILKKISEADAAVAAIYGNQTTQEA